MLTKQPKLKYLAQQALELEVKLPVLTESLIDAGVLKRVKTTIKHPTRRDYRTWLQPTTQSETWFKETSSCKDKTGQYVSVSYALTRKGQKSVEKMFKTVK
jgi:hypothetical protein